MLLNTFLLVQLDWLLADHLDEAGVRLNLPQVVFVLLKLFGDLDLV